MGEQAEVISIFRNHIAICKKRDVGKTNISYGVGKLPKSRRYNQLPLLRSSPGGFARSWPYRTYPYVHYLSSAKVRKNYDVTNIKEHFLSSRGHKRTFWRENRPQTTVFTHFFTKFATQRQQPFGLSPLP